MAVTNAICENGPKDAETPEPDQEHRSADDEAVADKTSTATIEKPRTRTRPTRPDRRVDKMPPWKVLLHNDDVNEMLYVVETISELTTLTLPDAYQHMLEAHLQGVSLLLMTHRERAELYREQFHSKRLTITIEPG